MHWRLSVLVTDPFMEAVKADAVQGRLVSPEVRTRLADLAVAVTGVRNG